jgi:hypothetical protein
METGAVVRFLPSDEASVCECAAGRSLKMSEFSTRNMGFMAGVLT